MPPFALRLMYGKRAVLFLDSRRPMPRKALASGFEFRYPVLEAALRELANNAPSGRVLLTDAKNGAGETSLDRPGQRGSAGV